VTNPGANQTITKYYYAGSQRIAMRTNGTLNYLLGDHLGSTSLTTNASGQIVSELRYKAWSETRYSSGTTPTKYTYTGQYSNMSDFGLMFYNARWYDPTLGRFAQADTIIPNAGDSQAWDHYAYASNNPVRYNDPSGHCSGDPNNSQNPDFGCWEMIRSISGNYDFISIDSANWTEKELRHVDKSLHALEKSLGGVDELRAATGNVSLYRRDKNWSDYFRTTPRVGGVTNLASRNLTFYDVGVGAGESDAVFTVLHELAHIYDVNNGFPSSTFKDEFWPGCVLAIRKCLFGGEPSDGGITVSGNGSPVEDFADTLAATVFTENFEQPNASMAEYPPGVLPLPGYVREPSQDRKNFILNLFIR
jgi:RHS repeat-associated protein